MVKWSRLWNGDDERPRHHGQETERLLPHHTHDLGPSAIPAKDVTRVALRLKYQIEQVIPCELEEAQITRANSAIITPKVVKTAREAGGEEHRSCVIYCLLVCRRWFRRQANLELWDSDLHDVRAVACEVIAKRIIEEEDNEDFLLNELLLKRFSVLRNGNETEPANAIERSVDLHALRIIGSSGYQKCVKYLWQGWIVQDEFNSGSFISWKDRDNPSYWAHLNPDRMRTPRYQNAVHVLFSLIFLGMYTGAVNTVNEDGDLDIVEGILYIMTFGYICDEFAKFWKVGRNYFGFWNAFNIVLYAILTTSFVIRMVALAQSDSEGNERRHELNKRGYHFFAAAAPMFWARLLLNLDSFRFFGAMLVVLKVMMRESLIFFALLFLICIGFLQSFVGFNQTEDDSRKIMAEVVQAMVNAVMQSPEFDGFDDYAHPFGLIMYYIFTFVVMVILLNILVALFNSAYEDITDNAIDEYMALFAQKTMGYVRAPDENVFIAPFNLIELFGLILPFEWWMSTKRYERLNQYVMGIIYSPLLLVTAYLEVKDAKKVRSNRRRGEADDDTVEEWEQMDVSAEFGNEGWTKWKNQVDDTKPDVKNDTDVIEIRELKKQVRELTTLVQRLSPEPEDKESGEGSK